MKRGTRYLAEMEIVEQRDGYSILDDLPIQIVLYESEYVRDPLYAQVSR